MKKIASLLLLILAVCTSCSDSDIETEEPVNMDEMMKISTWLLDDELEGTGSWGYISLEEKTFPRKADGDGYWIPDDGVTQVENEDVFEFEALEVGVPRTMAPMTLHMARDKGDGINYSNLNLHIDFDGIVEVVKAEPNDSSIILKYALGQDSSGAPIEAEAIKVNGPCVINVCPVGEVAASEGTGNFNLISTDTIVGKEYTLQIRGCSWDGTPIITAEVKLTAIPDPEYPWQTIHERRYGTLNADYEERTRFCSVELVSYDYSEMYDLMGKAGNVD